MSFSRSQAIRSTSALQSTFWFSSPGGGVVQTAFTVQSCLCGQLFAKDGVGSTVAPWSHPKRKGCLPRSHSLYWEYVAHAPLVHDLPG